MTLMIPATTSTEPHITACASSQSQKTDFESYDLVPEYSSPTSKDLLSDEEDENDLELASCGSCLDNFFIFFNYHEDSEDENLAKKRTQGGVGVRVNVSKSKSYFKSPTKRGDTEEDCENDTSDDDASLPFVAPLNHELSYSVSSFPPAYEIIPTISDSQHSAAQLKSRRKRVSIYGGPTGSRAINTNHVNGRKIDRKHAQYALSLGMMLGIRECVGGVTSLCEEEMLPDVLDEEDYYSNDGGEVERHKLMFECARVQKYTFTSDPHALRTAEQRNKSKSILSRKSRRSLPYSYEFKAYAPLVFAKLRKAFGVERQQFLHSISGKFNFIEFMSNAKSGQFFCYSHDGRYMIKTQTLDESKFLRHILPDYFSFMMKHPYSHLTHFYGLYRVRMPDIGKCTYFVIMKSVFNTEKEIHKIWDLKGSTKGRRASRGDSVHKDMDLVDEGRKLHFGPKVKKEFLDQLRIDTRFLSKMGIMDYSLLLGVHVRTEQVDPITRMEVENLIQGVEGDDLLRSTPEIMRSNTPHRRRLLMEANKKREKEAKKLDTDQEISLKHSSSLDSQRSDAMHRKRVMFTSSDEQSNIISADSESVDKSTVGGFTDDEISVAMSRGSSLDGASSVERLGESQDDSEAYAINEWKERTGSGLLWPSPYSLGEIDSTCNPMTSREDLGIESVTHDARSNRLVSNEIYFCGIIDILQHYNARKYAETVMRKAAGNSTSEISCVDPDTYASRFNDFIEKLVD